MFISRITSCKIQQGVQTATTLMKNISRCVVTVAKEKIEDCDNVTPKKREEDNKKEIKITPEYRFVYPDFLPDPNPIFRNALREKLERMDMLARRTRIAIPEFYVGSVLRVIYSEPHAPGKTNSFTGICVLREGTGLRSTITLRNVIDGEGVEVIYKLYDPTIQKVDCLKLEKRLDSDLLYLRDAPLEYSMVPLDMETVILPEGAPIPVNDIKIPLNPPPWILKWEQKGYKGISTDLLSLVTENRKRKAAKNATPWEKYDLMKKYRETIPVDEQMEIYNEIKSDVDAINVVRYKLKYKRQFIRPKKKA